MEEKKRDIISIVIPVHNAEPYIAKTIRSILTQTVSDYEVLLVDDASTDGSLEKIRQIRDARLKVLKVHPEHAVGAAGARNRGIEAARGRYLAFLDADDLWHPKKLENTLMYMKKKDAAFVFTGYEFGDQNGRGTGKIVHVPKVLDYEHALSRTVIFTSTVMFDLTKIDKELIRMPQVKSEDTATWWKILRSGYLAYGLDENLTIYRRAGKTLSSNKLEAVRRIWNLYKLQEGMSLFKRLRCFVGWAVGAVYRRL